MTTSSDHSHPVVGPAPAGVTASTARSDEDGSTSSARRESSQEPTPPPRLPLTSRPTEILSHMFSHVPYDDYDRLIEQITLNKRYFAVAYPHWMRKLTLDGNDADIVFAAIGMHAASSLIREIDACFLPLLPQTQCAIFRHTPNLTHLTVDLSDDYDDYPLPTCFFAALRTLRHLSTLRFAMTREASQSMTSPSNATSLPFANSTLLPTAVSQPLTHLTISSTEFAAAAIPWETLHYLDIGLLDLGEPDFIDSLQDVCKDSAIPLRGLTFRLSNRIFDDLRCFSEIIHGIDSFADSKSWTFSARLPSVLHLKLGGCSNYDTTDALRGLRAFLDLCPAAQSLRLIGFQYYPDNPTNPRPVPSAAKEAILGSIRDKNLPFAFPAISALLFLLLQTSILDVYLELSTNGGIRWRRASCSEVFEGERWTVI
ncbi:hypothetical protein RTBOTA2_003470 [Rhodotorula toruloides]|nr:hypothetical protein RTBOTA2_003470 [Rhodotorula toruloides]